MSEEWSPISDAKFSDGDSVVLKYTSKDKNFEVVSQAIYFNGRFCFNGLRHIVDIFIDALSNDKENVFYRKTA